MSKSTIVDGRNCLQSETITEAGLDYWSVGRPPVINLTGIRQMAIYDPSVSHGTTSGAAEVDDTDEVDDMVEVR
jgi:hypothetical protein